MERLFHTAARAFSTPVYSVAMVRVVKYGLPGPSTDRIAPAFPPPVIRAKPWHPQMWALVGLIGWMAWGWLGVPDTALAAAAPAKAGDPGVLRSGAFDRAALQDELSLSLPELQGRSHGELRAYVERLAQLHASLEGESDLSPSERRDLRERILVRAAQVGLMLRERGGAPEASGGRRQASAVALGLASVVGLAGALLGNSGILVGLLGGLVIAFALGNLTGYRRGAGQASYYGEGDPRIRFLMRPPARPARQGEPGRISLPLIREALADGRTVLLQLGYDVAPSQHPRYLGLLRQMQQALEGADGLTHTAWEDPRHPHRFYELLVCRRAAALDALTTSDGLLARLGEEIEACRLPGGLVLRRIWWSVSARARGAGRLPPIPEEASIRGEVS